MSDEEHPRSTAVPGAVWIPLDNRQRRKIHRALRLSAELAVAVDDTADAAEDRELARFVLGDLQPLEATRPQPRSIIEQHRHGIIERMEDEGTLDPDCDICKGWLYPYQDPSDTRNPVHGQPGHETPSGPRKDYWPGKS